jgi:hypothetical protein
MLVVRISFVFGMVDLEAGGAVGFGWGISCDGECLRGGDGSTGAE